MKKKSAHLSTITSKYQTVIPAAIRKTANLHINEEIVWNVIKTKDLPIIFISPKPKDWSKYLSGLGKRVWKDVDTDTYLNQLREEWNR